MLIHFRCFSEPAGKALEALTVRQSECMLGRFLIIKCLDFADKMKYTTIMLMFRSLHIFANLNTFRELDTSYIKKLWQYLNLFLNIHFFRLRCVWYYDCRYFVLTIAIFCEWDIVILSTFVFFLFFSLRQWKHVWRQSAILYRACADARHSLLF